MAQSQVRRNAWEGQNGRTEAEHRELLHAYIYDYCKKRNFHQAARAFAAEAGVATDQAPPVDNPTAFLYDWWGVFWDVFSQRSNDAFAGKDGQMSNHARFLQHRREELLQQHRAYNNMASHQQQQQMRRASEAQPSNQSPQQQHPLHPPQQPLPPQQAQQQQPTPQQQPQVPPQAQTPHMQSVPSQQRDARSSPASSTASLPNSGVPHPNSTLVNTPQSMPANLPPQQQHLPARHANSPSFSPQQMQRPDGMHPSEHMVNSPMGQQMQPPMQRPQMNPNMNAAMFNAALSALNLQGRDPTTFTPEEKNAVHAQMRRQHQLYTQNMMRQNPGMFANNQARLQQQAMLNQQMMQQHQQQQQQQQQQPQPPQSQPPQQTPQQTPAQLQQQPGQGMPQSQATPQPPHPQAQMHGMEMNRSAANQPGNGQPRPMAMSGPGVQGQMAMQNPNMMGGPPFGNDAMNMMLAQQVMGKGQMPSNLTPQQHQQLLARQQQQQQQQRAMLTQQQQQQQRLMQQRQQQMQQQQQQQQQPPQGGQTPAMNPMAAANQPMPMSPQDQEKRNNAAIINYQRQQRQQHMLMQQQQMGGHQPMPPQQQQPQMPMGQQGQAQQQQPQQPQQQQGGIHPSKRQRTNPEEDRGSPTNPSPQLHNMASPQNMMGTPGRMQESPAMAMQNRLPQQQATPQQQRASFSSQSPQVSRTNAPKQTPRMTPAQAHQSLPQQQQQQQQNNQQATPQQQSRMAPGAGSSGTSGWNGSEMDSPVKQEAQAQQNQSPVAGAMQAAAQAAQVAQAAQQQQQQQQPGNQGQGQGGNGPGNNGSFDLERFMMSDDANFDMFATDDNVDTNLLMNGENDLDPFGGGFLASMGGGLGVDNTLLPVAEQGLQPYGDLQGHTMKVNTCAFSPNGQWLASGGHDKRAIIWSVAEKRKLYTLEGHEKQITCARWSPDTRHLLVTSSYDKTIRIWDIGTALKDSASQAQQTLKLDCRTSVTAVDFAPNRPDIVCSMDAEGELKVWNLSTGKCEKTVRMPCAKASFSTNPIRFRPHESNIVACAVGNQLYVIDIQSVKNNSSVESPAIKTIYTEHSKNNASTIASLDFSSDGNFLVSSSENVICVHDTAHWKSQAVHSTSSKVHTCAFAVSEGGGIDKLRVIYGEYQAIYLWQCGTPGSNAKQVGRQSGGVAGIDCAITDATQVVATASLNKENNLVLWSLQSIV